LISQYPFRLVNDNVLNRQYNSSIIFYKSLLN